MKKAAIVVLVLLLCFFTEAFAASTSEALISKLCNESFDMEETEIMTRGKFASVAAKLYFDEIEVAENKVSPFVDVSVSHPDFNGIYTLNKLNIIAGNGGNFRPDDGITYAEAATIILKVAGYDYIASENGGWPSGYMYVATVNGLFKNVEIKDEAVTNKDAMEMLYNSMFIEAIEMTHIKDGNPVYSATGKTILENKFEVIKLNGMITDDGFMSFDNSGTDKNGIIKLKETNGNTVTLYSENEVSDLFAKNVVAYARYNDTKDMYELLYAGLSNKVSVTKVNGETIIQKSSSHIEYETDKENGKTEKINFTSPYVFVNGKRITEFSPKFLKPENGFNEFIDNNGDNRADVILIWDFHFSDIVERIDETGIALKRNPSNNLSVDKEENVYRFIKEEKEVAYTEIAVNDILSVCKNEISGKNYYFVYVSTKVVKGTIVSVEDREQITIETLTFGISPEIRNDNTFFAKAKAGESATFYVDYLDNIIYCDKAVAGDVNYFYMIDMKKSTNGPEGEISIYTYTRNAVFAEYKINEKNLVIDGKRLDGKTEDGLTASVYDEIRELLCIRPDGTCEYPDSATYTLQGKKLTNIISRPAIYKVNSRNEITYLDTDAPTYSDKKLEEADEYTLKPGVRYIKDSVFTEKNKSFNGRFFISDESLVLKVADIDRYNLPSNTNNNFIKLYEQNVGDPENYYVYSSGELTKNQSYDIQAYNIDPETGVCGLAVIRGTVEKHYSNADYRQALCVFDRITEYYDEALEKNIYKMYYVNYGNNESVKVNPEEIHDFCNNILFGGKYPSKDGGEIDVKPLKRGDVIYINVNNGYLTHIQRELDVSRINQKSASSAHSTGAYNPYYATSSAAGVFDVPFDQRDINQTHDYISTYVMDLAIPYSISGNILAIKKTALAGASQNGNTAYTSLEKYIQAGSGAELVTKYINYTSAGITVVEELSHSADGNCKFKVKAGTVSDINYMGGYPEEEGFYKASRVYTYDEQSNVMGIIIFNLLEEHNHVQ